MVVNRAGGRKKRGEVARYAPSVGGSGSSSGGSTASARTGGKAWGLASSSSRTKRKTNRADVLMEDAQGRMTKRRRVAVPMLPPEGCDAGASRQPAQLPHRAHQVL